MSRIQDQQFDQMMQEESDNWQRKLQEDEEYEMWLIEQEKESERIRAAS